MKPGFAQKLVLSAPAYAKASASVQQPFSTQFWSVVNRSYDIEQPKYVAQALAWIFRGFGFKVGIVVDRPSVDGEALRNEWRRLTPKTLFYFSGEHGDLKSYLGRVNFILFFVSKDSSIMESRKAGVYAVRLKKGPKSHNKEDYNPGALNEFVLPLSQY